MGSENYPSFFIVLTQSFFCCILIFIKKMNDMKKIIRLTESDLHNIVKGSVKKIIKEAWKDDRFEYDHLSDEGNGGLEEYGMNIANLIMGLGTDSDSLHGLGEEVAQHILNNGDDETTKERVLKPFIEGLIAWYKNLGDPNIAYQEHGIERN